MEKLTLILQQFRERNHPIDGAVATIVLYRFSSSSPLEPDRTDADAMAGFSSTLTTRKAACPTCSGVAPIAHFPFRTALPKGEAALRKLAIG
jgi:hypothetical protein